ncbi:MAG: hypothetical protein KF735_17810 [Chelatococcus sp.]|nr:MULTISPECIES: hypothetical protein [unclassified Chelatococcus]MBS7739009.1 hypothetical protein [Chelatococcus sp. HY11]MBX3539503.1 hypothetical protein [Chelatococcus sp.]MBX3543444.1 hypothetical protein [Chelatococcus sp.]MCO5076461.1 hypothetical protein [Chelatococcus sp.]
MVLFALRAGVAGSSLINKDYFCAAANIGVEPGDHLIDLAVSYAHR